MQAVQAPEAEWLLKEDAAKHIGATVRSVERSARKGLIETRYLPKAPNEKQARVVYLRSDLDRIIDDRRWPTAMDPVTKRPTTDTALTVARSGAGQMDVWSALAAHLAKLSTVHAPPITKAWLTLDESVEYSGLPRQEMAVLLREKWIYSLGRGPKTWRVQRESLDAYGKAAHQ